MAVTAQALSPWPSTTLPSQRAAAIERLKQAIAGRAAESDEIACSLGELAAARVEREAPDAPSAVRDECVIRYAGYLAQSDYGGIVREEVGGVRVVEYVTNHSNAWRNSGAAGLLSVWKKRRAGPIG